MRAVAPKASCILCPYARGNYIDVFLYVGICIIALYKYIRTKLSANGPVVKAYGKIYTCLYLPKISKNKTSNIMPTSYRYI